MRIVCIESRKDLASIENKDTDFKNILIVMTVLAFMDYPLTCKASILFSDPESWYHPIIQKLGSEARTIVEKIEQEDMPIKKWLNKTIGPKDLRVWNAAIEISDWIPEIIFEKKRSVVSAIEKQLISRLIQRVSRKDIRESLGYCDKVIHNIMVDRQENRNRRTALPAWVKNGIANDPGPRRLLVDKYYTSLSSIANIKKQTDLSMH